MLSGFNLFQDSSFTRISYLFFAGFLAFLFFLAKDAVKQFRSIKTVGFKLVFVVVIMIFFFGFWLCFPGLMVIDDAAAAKEIFAGHPYTWLSLSYAFLLAGGYMLVGQVGFIPVLSITLYGYLLLRAFRLIDDADLAVKWKWLCVLLLAALSLNPIMQGLLVFHSRDIIFSLAATFVGLLFFERKEWSNKEIFFLSALIVYLSDLRADGKLYLVVVPLLFLFAKIWTRRQAILSYVSLAAIGLIYLLIIPWWLDARTITIGYKVTAWVMPLSQIYHDIGAKNIDPEINAKINPVLDVEKLENNFSPVDIDPFHAGAFNSATTPEQWFEFQSAAVKLISEHLDLYVKNRVNLFSTMLNVSANETFIYYDDFHGSNETSLKIRSLLLQPEGDYSFNGVSKKYYNFLGWWGRSKNILIQIFNSLALPLVFCLYCLRYFRSRPEFFCFSILVLVRIPIIFFLAPASYTRYIMTVLLFFVFGFPLLISRLKSEISKS